MVRFIYNVFESTFSTIRSYLPHTVGICPPDPICYILTFLSNFNTEPFPHLKYIGIISKMIDKKDISYQRRSRVIPLIKSTKSTFIPKSIIQSLNDIWKNNLDGKTLILKLDKTKTLSDDLKQLRDNLRNKKNLEGIKDWSNIYIDYFAKNIFKKFKSKNIAESHARLNQFIIGDVKFADPNYDTLRKWASIFTKSVMLVHYGYYQLNRYDLKIYKKGDNSIKLTKHSTELTKIFYENFKVKPSDIRIEGNKLR